jgi:hypothetical protein
VNAPTPLTFARPPRFVAGVVLLTMDVDVPDWSMGTHVGGSIAVFERTAFNDLLIIVGVCLHTDRDGSQFMPPTSCASFGPFKSMSSRDCGMSKISTTQMNLWKHVDDKPFFLFARVVGPISAESNRS